MGFPGGGEILAILVVALVVFGPNRLPEIARQLGSAMRTLRDMQSTVKRELSDALDLHGLKADAYAAAPNYAEHGFDEPPPPPVPAPTFQQIEPPTGSFD